MSFKDEFLKMPPGAAREELVYQAVIKQGPPKNLVPITVPGPNGTKITYKTMADYVTVDGFRVTMTPFTAQRVANHFGMSLPTAKMSQQIYDAADTKVRAPPLSGTGYTDPITGKKYSAKEVVENRISSSDAAVYYSDLTNKEIAKHKNPVLISGHGKEITEPGIGATSHDVSFGGWQGSTGEPLQPYTYAHKGQAEAHTEYALNTRLVDDKVIVTLSNGKSVEKTIQELRANPNMAGAISNSTIVRQYGVDTKSKETLPIKPMSIKKEKPSFVAEKQISKSPPQRMALLNKIDSLLDQFGKEV